MRIKARAQGGREVRKFCIPSLGMVRTAMVMMRPKRVATRKMAKRARQSPRPTPVGERWEGGWVGWWVGGLMRKRVATRKIAKRARQSPRPTPIGRSGWVGGWKRKRRRKRRRRRRRRRRTYQGGLRGWRRPAR